jgi:hypothetical protein
MWCTGVCRALALVCAQRLAVTLKQVCCGSPAPVSCMLIVRVCMLACPCFKLQHAAAWTPAGVVPLRRGQRCALPWLFIV